jgi:type I restriction enzyme S subunit
MSVVGMPGYRETEIGWIPSDWNYATFATLLAEKPEYGANASAEGIGGDGHVRYIRITDISENGALIESGKKYIPMVVGKEYLLAENDILIARTGNTVGKSLLFRASMGESAFAGYLIRFRVGDSLDCHFASQFLRSDAYWAWVKGAIKVGAQPNINSQQYQSMLMPVPPLPEQEKIAAILATVDDKLDVIARQIEATQTLKQGLMQTLFSRGAGNQDADGRWVPHTEFKDSELGEIPVGWEVRSLESVADVERGKFSARPRNDPKYFDAGDIPFIQTGDIASATRYVERASQFLNADGLGVSKQFPAGTIFITIAANIGDVAIAKIPMACPDSVVGIRANVDICDSTWLYYLLANSKDYFDSRATQNAQKNINLQVLRPFLFAMPTVTEQRHVAGILTALDDRLDVLISKKNHHQTLKRGLMQKLLTGEWRVTLGAHQETAIAA